MNFLLGLMVGSALMSGEPHHRLGPLLAEIPFRCFAALDAGDAAYVECRRLSMAYQITQQYNNSRDDVNGIHGMRAAVDAALQLELKALRALEAKAATAK